MMIDDITMLFLGCILTFVIGFCVGHTVLHKDTWLTLDKISHWIDNTNSNKWVQYYMYQDLETKYDNLSKEYEQYRGAMKAINDCCKKHNDGDMDGKIP